MQRLALIAVVVANGCGHGARSDADRGADGRSDRDRDGLADIDDLCEIEAEDGDGCDDEDGCPDPDDDGDGVMDVDDTCPYAAESISGRHVHRDGCPESGDVRVTSFDRCLLILDSVFFPSGSSVLSAEQSEVVDQLSRFLRGCPEHLVIQVEGHGDERESASDVAAERADVVRRRLLAGGIVAKRLRVVGRGAEQPVDPGHSNEAWAKNRRVEFHVVRALTCPRRSGDRPGP